MLGILEPFFTGHSVQEEKLLLLKSIDATKKGTSSNTTTMNAPITINGVPTGKEVTVAKAVHKAIQDPIRATLAEYKKAKAYEDRLTFA